MRQLNFMSEFTKNVLYLDGAKNLEADCFIRSTKVNVLFVKKRSLHFGVMSDEQAVDLKICF